jgi:hypothetical protein
LQYNFYAISFLFLLPFLGYAFWRLDKIVFIEQRPIIFLDGRVLIFSSREKFGVDIRDVEIQRQRYRFLMRIYICGNGKKLILPIGLSKSQSDIIADVERLKLPNPASEASSAPSNPLPRPG